MRLRRRSNHEWPSTAGKPHARKEQDTKMHRSTHGWLFGIAMCAVACVNARSRPEVVASLQPQATSASVAAALHDTVRAVLGRALADSAFPGAIAVVGNRRGELTAVAVGHLTWGEPAVPDRHSIWDMASLTKVVATTTSIMRLVDQGKVDVNAPVQTYLPDWVGPGKSAVTVRHLLTHTAGLPSFKAYDRITTNRDSIDKLMFGTPLDSTPGHAMIYSDIGGYLLGKIVERVSGEPLDKYVVRAIFAPVGMRETMFLPPASLLPRIAPTEIDSLRGGLVRGKVHDERAYYLGGVSGHAGLFSSANDLSIFARILLNGGSVHDTTLVSTKTLRLFTAYADSTFSDRGLGWQKPAIPGMEFHTGGAWGSSKRVSTAAFGHTGFTGTSILMDPVHDVYIILLSNRVNPTRANTKIGGVRTRLTDAVMSVLESAASPSH
jgi:serine-type D-Ala-D-Ala carboxypeptidase